MPGPRETRSRSLPPERRRLERISSVPDLYNPGRHGNLFEGFTPGHTGYQRENRFEKLQSDHPRQGSLVADHTGAQFITGEGKESQDLFGPVPNTEIIHEARKKLSDRVAGKKIHLEARWETPQALLVVGQMKLKESQEILDAVRETLDKSPSPSTLDKLANWSIRDFFKGLKERWTSESAGAPQENVDGIESHINAISVEVNELEARLKALRPLEDAIHGTRNEIGNAISKIPSMRSLAKHYDKLQVAIVKTDDCTVRKDFLQNIDEQEAKWRGIYQTRLELLGEAESQRAKIDASIDKTKSALQTVPVIYDVFEKLDTRRGKKEQDESEAILATVREKLYKSPDRVNKLVGREIENLEDLQVRWLSENPEEPLETMDAWNNAVEKAKIELENHWDELHRLKNAIRGEIYPLSSVESFKTEDYKRLRSDIKRKVDPTERASLLREVDKQDTIWQEIDQSKRGLQEQAESWLKKIDASMDKTNEALQEVTNDYHQFKPRNPADYPFFREEDMLIPNEPGRIEFVPMKGKGLGESTVNMIMTLLKAQGVNRAENRIAEALGSGEVPIGQIPTILSDLGDQEGYQSQNMLPRDLERVLPHAPVGALPHRPVGALLHTLSGDSRIVYAVSLSHIEWDPLTREPWVVVHDGSRPAPYKVCVDRFAQAWPGSAFLPKNAIKELEQ